jgi:integrase
VRGISTVGTQICYPTTKRVHSWFTSTGNPIELALEEAGDRIIGSKSSRHPEIITVAEMGEYIRSLEHPLWETIAGMLAKTTIRRGALHNLDIQDIYIDHPACNWDVHRKLRRKDHPFIYISSKPEKDRLWKDRQRVPEATNKTSVDRIIPIDDELRNLLLWWLTVHPGPLESDTPLFVSLSDNWGERIHPESIRYKISEHSKELGYWYQAHDDDNINPHYFRHWSTSVIDERLETTDNSYSSTVKMLRGDKKSTQDDYTHWTDGRVERYCQITPKFYNQYDTLPAWHK